MAIHLTRAAQTKGDFFSIDANWFASYKHKPAVFVTAPPIKDIYSMEKKKHVFAKELSSQQRAKLKGLAHPLKPLVQVGGGGFSDTLVQEIAKALDHHELIKIQLPGQSDASQKKEETAALESNIPPHAHIVSRIGRMVILYLEKDPAKSPKIKLSAL